VLLSHGNFTSNSIAGQKMYPELKKNDGRDTLTLAILPWAHSFGQTGELFAIIRLGGALGLAESPSTIVDDIVKVKPTFLVAVPRVFNRIYDGLWARMNKEGGLPKALFVMGVEAGKKRRQLAAQGRSDFLTNLKFKIADKIVFSKIREKLGGRVMGAMTGSAAMNPEIGHFFFDIGLPVYDCYGLTETSPAATMNASFAYRLGSVGRAIDKVRIVIDSSVVEEGATDGEIIIYGPNVMKGYHNRPEDTAAAMTPDGGFRTGDRGRLDKDGYLFITGRIKEQYKLENGKFCFPVSLEEEICLIPYVQQAVIYGFNRPFNICIVVPDFEVLTGWAKAKGLPTEPQALAARPEVAEMLSQTITSHLQGKFGGYEIPKKFLVLAEPFSLDNGMLTQTMKLKRKVVLDKLKDQIEALYR
jgi:long-chain acyl-CoA synthetase